MKIRIRFRKWGVMKFVGHLDMMRYFQKAIRRSGIDIAYSAGYSPHQIMSFASPLGLGLTSDGEYLDIQVNSTLSSAASVEALNGTMAKGVEVLSYRLLPDDAKNAMSIVAAADYLVSFADTGEDFSLKELVDAFLSMETVPVIKKTKKGEMQADLRSMVHALSWEKGRLFLKLSAGSSVNCKPVQVLEALSTISLKDPYQSREAEKNQNLLAKILQEYPFRIKIHRMELYADLGTEGCMRLVPLEDLGEEIV